MKLLLQFAAVRCRRSVDQLVIEDLTAPMVLDFLADLETSRGNTIRTRNSQGENQLWLLPAARYWPFPRKRRFALYWAISASRSLVICWLKSTA
jgi:hypothetical protein